MLRRIITVLAVVVLVSSVVAPFAGVAGAQQSAPSGMVGVPSTNVAPVTAVDSYPGGVEPTSLPTAASDWSVQSSEHAGDLELAVGEVGGNLALVFTDDQNHAGREVAVDAATLEDAVGYRPKLAYGLHEDGSRWTSEIRYENGHAVIEVPKFSSNTVTFSGEVSITATPSSDGSSYSYNLSDLDSASNFTIDVTGVDNSAWDNESAANVGPSTSQSISVGGNENASGPNANGNPTLTASLPVEKFGSVTDSNVLSDPGDVAVSGKYAYVAGYKDNSLAIVDISSPSNPSIVGSVVDINNLERAISVVVDGNYAYVAAGTSDQVTVVDVSTPSDPSVAANVSLSTPTGIATDGSYVYATEYYNDKVVVVDVSTPTSPSVVGSVTDAAMGNPRDVEVNGTSNYAYVAGESADSLVSVNVSSPSSPAVAGSVSDATRLNGSRDVVLDGSEAYVSAPEGDRVTSVDISSPSTPAILDSAAGVENANSIDIHNGVVTVKGQDYSHVDVSSPSSLRQVSTTSLSTEAPGIYGMAVNGSRAVYVTTNRLVTATPYESTSSLSASSDGASASFGSIESGDSVTKEYALTTDATAISWSGSGDAIDSHLEMREHTITEDVEIGVNSDSTSYSGKLSPGTTASLSTNTSWLQEGENRVDVTVDSTDSLTSDAPTPQVDLVYSHDAVDDQSVTYDSEAYSERYNVSKKYASDRTGATLTIPFATTVVDVRNLETRTNGGTWSTVASSDYSLTETELTVQLGDVTAGDEVEVRTTATKVAVTNGSITVTEPTVLGEDLSTKLRIDSYSSGFALDVNATAYNDHLHYTHSESWTNAQSYASVTADGSQSVRMPKAGAGETTRLATLPLEVNPSGGQYDVRVSSAGAEPELQVRDTTTASEADLVWKNTDSGSTYQLYSLSADEERDRGTAQSPVTLTHSGISELLVIYNLGGGGGGGGGGGATSSGTTIAGLQPVMLIGAAVGGLALLFIVSRRYGDASLSDTALFGAGALIIGIVAVQSLAPDILAAAIGRAIQDAGPLIVLGLIASVIIWLRQRGDDVTLNIRGK